MDESKASPHKVKVVDRRKFTAEGDPRDGEDRASSGSKSHPPNDSSNPPENSRTTPTERRPEGNGSAGAHETSPQFLELVAMLAQQAEILLLGAEDLPAKPAEAQRVIDYLGALEEKTRGNLSSDEANVLESLVFQLRTLYLQHTNT